MNRIGLINRSAPFSSCSSREAIAAVLQVAIIIAAIMTPIGLPSQLCRIALRVGVALFGPSLIARLFYEKVGGSSPQKLQLVRETYFLQHKMEDGHIIPAADILVPNGGFEKIEGIRFHFDGSCASKCKLESGKRYMIDEGKFYEQIESNYYRFAGKDYLLEDGLFILVDRPILLKDGRLFSNGQFTMLSDFTTYRNHSIRPTGKYGEFEDKQQDRYLICRGDLYRKLPEPVYESNNGMMVFRETETSVSEGSLFSEKIVRQNEAPRKAEVERRFENIYTESGVAKQFEVVDQFILPPGQLHLIDQIAPEDLENGLTWYTGERWTFPPLWITDPIDI